jgi:hypothetical protein
VKLPSGGGCLAKSDWIAFLNLPLAYTKLLFMGSWHLRTFSWSDQRDRLRFRYVKCMGSKVSDISIFSIHLKCNVNMSDEKNNLLK